MMTWLLVALGGAGGAVARHGVGVLALRLMGQGFPWGTLAVNILGSLLMGLAVVVLADRFPDTGARYLPLITLLRIQPMNLESQLCGISQICLRLATYRCPCPFY